VVSAASIRKNSGAASTYSRFSDLIDLLGSVELFDYFGGNQNSDLNPGADA